MKFDDATVVYSLINPIRSKIFNFNKFIRNCNHDHNILRLFDD